MEERSGGASRSRREPEDTKRHTCALHLGVQGPLELQHVGILLWVDEVVREDDRQTVHCQSGREE